MSANCLAILSAVREHTRRRVVFYNSERCPLYMQDRGTRESDYFGALYLVQHGLAF